MSGESERTLNLLRDERGVALLVCLLVMAILTVVVLEFHYEVQVDAALTGNSFLALEAEYAARSGVAFCMAMLREDAANDLELSKDLRTDSLTEEWVLGLEPIQVARGIVTARIFDEDGKLNINRVVSTERDKKDEKEARLQLKRLFAELAILDNADPDERIIFVRDWIDADSVTMHDAEEDYYRNLPVPYVCKNSWLDSIEELALIKGFTREIVFGQRTWTETEFFTEELIEPGLADYLTVFGSGEGRVNINTASEPVIRAVFGQNTVIPDTIVSRRQTAPFTNMADLKQRVPAVIRMREIGKNLAFRSNCFSIVSEGVVHGMRVTIETVVRRRVPGDADGVRNVSFETLAWKVTR
ncbi:MAG: general secretion pathway protein GspK [Candidatus Hydrogenedentes bacterium]|jgi:general secretion pathway protein K|nr:general secretion pathway protein GspK [Candidatus Hydrogenedentota bacterium]